MNKSFIPFHLPSIGDEEVREVEAALRSGWLTTGPRTAQFEQEFAHYTGAPHALGLNSCTSALHVALVALGIGPGDEVITTPLTFCATVHAILHIGATPVLADVGCDGNIDPNEVEGRITDRTRAIVPVHLGGLPCDMQDLWMIAQSRGIHVVEDAAHAAGARYRNRQIGAGPSDGQLASDAVAFSFYATKNLTTGEGGMVTTPSPALDRKMRELALHGTSRGAWERYTEHGNWYYEVVDGGFKYNLSDIQSAIGIHQLRKLDDFIQTRTRYADLYFRLLGDLDEIELPPDNPQCRHAWHLYSIRLNLDRLRIDRKEFIVRLHQRGIGTSVHFIPVPMHPYFAGLNLPGAECPVTRALYPRLVSLPLYPAMTEEQVQYVARSVREIAEEARREKYFSAAWAATADEQRP
jgi:dTDP-4-amino-4,6-dideoxygalactose transaminase